jgi:hypothetical protein
VIYKITRFDGKYYIGRHSTDNIEDDYFGSGSYIQKSLKKHGKSKHTKEIIDLLSSYEDCVERERQLITLEVLNDPLCMNYQIGGMGGYCPSQEVRSLLSEGTKNAWKNDEYKQKVTQASIDRWKDEQWRITMGNKISKGLKESKILSDAKRALWQKEEYRAKMLNHLEHVHQHNSELWLNEDYRDRMSKHMTAQIKARWKKPIWITNGEVIKKIEDVDLADYETKGFKKGRSLTKK